MNMIGWVKINYHLVRSDSSSERNESNEFRFRFSDLIESYSFNTVRYDTYVWDKLNMQKCEAQEEHGDVCVRQTYWQRQPVRWPQQGAGQEPGREPGRKRALATCLLPCILIVQIPRRFIYWDLMGLFCHCFGQPKMSSYTRKTAGATTWACTSLFKQTKSQGSLRLAREKGKEAGCTFL